METKRLYNVQADPKLQLFVAEDMEEEEPELRLYYCASCKSKLNYHKHLSIWICSECFAEYDTKIQDVPIKDTKEFRVKTYPELEANPTYDEQDIYLPFVDAVNLCRDESYVSLSRSRRPSREEYQLPQITILITI